MTATSLAALLLLSDGRFPAGTHAHSGGLEASVTLEGVDDVPALETFLRGRVSTVGAVAAAFAAAACATATATSTAPVEGLCELQREFDARTPSPTMRQASVRLGRQLLRAAREVWPHQRLDELAERFPHGWHQPVALGAVAATAGLDPHAAALSVLHDAAVGPATAAVRLLGLDPFAVHAALARLGPQLDDAVTVAAGHAHTPPQDLPSWAAPLLDISTERHATWEVRLFAS